MKIILGLTLGFALAFSPFLAAQEPTPDKEKPRPEEPRGQEPGNPKQQPQPNEKPNPQKQEPAPKQEKDQQKAEGKQQQQQEKERQKQAKEEEKKAKDTNSNQQQGQTAKQNSRTQQTSQAANGKGQRIPPQKFQASFGSGHHFHVRHLENGRRFQYGGYWFEMVEVWPAGWSYGDECYIDEDGDDYYLVDVYHPELRVMVIVVEA
jgi:hypothetical protein